ncbi:MAG TPA: hypothetical protein VKM72_13965 [Thermoanaerobaculia bacterium]|nr:hypothetical protein [Thermoanaerobaculia bacterium]
MSKSSPRKGASWLVDQITAAFEASGGGPALPQPHLSRPDLDGLVSQALEEELDRLEEEEEKSKAYGPTDVFGGTVGSGS